MGCFAAQTLAISGPYRGGELSGRFVELIDTKTGSSRRSVREGPFTSATGYDGNVGWSQDFSGGSHRLDSPDALALARSEAWLARRGWCDAHDRAAYRAYGQRAIGSALADVVTATPAGGSPLTLAFDARSHLLSLVEQQLNETRRLTSYSDWRSIGDVALPFVWDVEFPEDQAHERYVVRSVRPRNAGHRDSFSQPGLPNDFKILGGRRKTEIPLDFDGDRPIVGMSIDGREPLPFELDTGGHFILSTETATRLGLQGIGHGNELGAGTTITAERYVRVPMVRIGAAQIDGLVASILPMSYSRTNRGHQAPLAGFLGLSLFERFAATFDPSKHRLTLRSLRSIPKERERDVAMRLPVTFDDDAPLTPCSIDRITGPCMIDTGNAGWTIVEYHWAARHGLLQRLRRGVPYAGDVRVSRALIGLGTIDLVHQLVEYYGDSIRGSEATTVEASILSEQVLDRFVMTVDYGRGEVSLAPIVGAHFAPFDRSGLYAQKAKEGAFLVRSIADRSPAARAGVRVGDRIFDVGGKPAADLSRTEFVEITRGRPGTVVRYSIVRAGLSHKIIVNVRLAELLP